MSLSPSDIKSLQTRLEALGFRLFVPPDAGQDNQWFHIAIREFQIYASMDVTATVKDPTPDRWAARLVQTQLTDADKQNKYAGPIDGLYSDAVGKSLTYWETRGFRCPIVCDLVLRKGTGEYPPVDAKAPIGNYWRWDDPRITSYVASQSSIAEKKAIYQTLKLRVFDFARNFDPATKTACEEQAGTLMYLPVRLRYGKPPTPKKPRPHVLVREHVGAVTAYLPELKAASEVLPESMLGKSWGSITSPQTKSTFRVVRAVSEQECEGYLDCVNAYDDAGVSFGPYHWALSGGEDLRTPDQETAPSVSDLKVETGELPSVLACWAALHPNEAKRALQDRYGTTVDPTWTPGQPGKDGDNSWKSTRAYHGWIVSRGSSPDALDQFRTSHWFWRVLTLVRTEPTLRQTLWHMARLRIRDVLSYQIDPSDRPGQPAGPNKVPLSRLFTSELAVALLIRYHVRRGGFLIAQKYENTVGLRMALGFARNTADVTRWGHTEQQNLIKGLKATAAMTELTAAEKVRLKGIGAAKLWDQCDALASATGVFRDLRRACHELENWPASTRYQWSYSKVTPRTKAPYALPRAACERPPGPLDQPITPPLLPPVGLATWHGSFKLDDGGLPPMPS